MIRVLAIFRREFASYFNSLMAYFFMVIFLVSVNMLFMWLSVFRSRNAQMTDYFEIAVVAIWIFIPAVTMGMWSEEKRSGALELMMTMPIRDAEAVLGKFLAALAFLTVTLLLSMATIPVVLEYLGDPDWGPILGGYLGLFMLGAGFIAISLAMSSLTENQFIAFQLSTLIGLAFLAIADLLNFTKNSTIITAALIFVVACPIVYVGARVALQQVPNSRLLSAVIAVVVSGSLLAVGVVLEWIVAPEWQMLLINYIDAGGHFANMARGVIDSRDVIYFLSLTVFFLLVNHMSVSSRRWK